jgi:hypothetical protein
MHPFLQAGGVKSSSQVQTLAINRQTDGIVHKYLNSLAYPFALTDLLPRKKRRALSEKDANKTSAERLRPASGAGALKVRILCGNLEFEAATLSAAPPLNRWGAEAPAICGEAGT